MVGVGARLCLLATAASTLGADAHGRLTFPMTRSGHTGYENDPVRSNTDESFVCRHAQANSRVTPAAMSAGSTTQIQWDMSAPHVGDCALFISYDVDLPLSSQRYVKIANFPDCVSQNRQRVSVVIPSALPAGDAILRWDWRALHVFPTVEWYLQCADVRISSASTRTWDSFNKFQITNPPIYPSNGNQAPGFRNPYGGSFYVTGPACVDGSVNQCDLTAPGTRGYTGFGGDGATGPQPTPAPVPTPPPTPVTAGGTCNGQPCASTQHCRSQYGYCGAGSNYCNDRSTWNPSCSQTTAPTYAPTAAPTARPTAAPTTAPSPSPTSSGSCGSTCFGNSCNFWAEQGYTCAQLTGLYGCNCEGCSACAAAPTPAPTAAPTPAPTAAPTPAPTPSPTTSSGCPESCYGRSCDFWAAQGYTCAQLTETYRCACGGCSACTTPAPTPAPTSAGCSASAAAGEMGVTDAMCTSTCRLLPEGQWPCGRGQLCECANPSLLAVKAKRHSFLSLMQTVTTQRMAQHEL